MKKIVLEFQFEEVTDSFYPDDPPRLEATAIVRHPDTTMTDEEELMGFGEEVAQSDRWQVDRWIDIQDMLSTNTEKIEFD